jgi:transcriptional regulator with XRE-family HTH domain
LGERVRAARRSAEVTQEALAHASGLGAEHIQRIERGVANPTLATLYALSDALQVQPQSLMPD